MLTPRFRIALLAVPPLLALAGCGSNQSSTPPTPVPTVQAASVGAQAVVASSDLSVGRNRFTFGVLDNNHPVETGAPRVTFYSLNGPTPRREGTGTARFNQFAKGLKDSDANSAAVELGGVYVSYATFRTPGKWGAEIIMPIKGKLRILRTPAFTVLKLSKTPEIGSPAPRSNNPTTAQMPATKLDSGRPPDDMHKLSIAGAIAQHKPLVVLFATAAYCTSRMCGPEIEVVKGIENRYRGRVNFVHIEVYRNANPAYGYAPTFLQWHLPSEPWVFVVDRRGIVTGKFDGPTPASEIEPVIQKTLRA